jgi:NAD-dependent dihydropyrimidine dehydrogenase PreA subunit
MTYIIAQPCIDVKDASCVEVCPVDCIYEADDQYYIHPDECIDCGACEPGRPVRVDELHREEQGALRIGPSGPEAKQESGGGSESLRRFLHAPAQPGLGRVKWDAGVGTRGR